MGNISELARFVEQHRRLFLLTGAGCSTESGIPDYRNAAGEWKRKPPVDFRDFVSNEHTRRRYWARSLIGWRQISGAEPNRAHRALVALEARGCVERLVTQNVDGLHEAAGSQNVLDLHGRADRVVCLACERLMPRVELQRALLDLNPEFAELRAAPAPDGDADLDAVDFAGFEVPSCGACGGILKTDVVFFGEGVPRERVGSAMASLERADALLVVGSSLMVYSGYRFAKAMALSGRPVAAVNLGRTRADALLTLKVEASCSEALAFALSPG
jgi:NAD-dependent SIR2 family protein deacetylase